MMPNMEKNLLGNSFIVKVQLYNHCNICFVDESITFKIQVWTFAYVRLLNKPYENQVTLTGQNPPLRCCQPFEILAHFITGLDLFILEI